MATAAVYPPEVDVRRSTFLVAWSALIPLLAGCSRESRIPTGSPDPRRSIEQSAPDQGVQQRSRPWSDGDWFEDRTSQSGVDFAFRTGREAGHHTILETVGGGVGLIDLDLDSRVDLFAIGGGTIDSRTSVPRGVPCGLFRNLGKGQFHRTPAAVLPTATDYSHGVLAGDFNQDGIPDLFVTCQGKCSLFLNWGDGTFSDVAAEAGLDAVGWQTASACGDFDADGDLDLFVAQYVDWRPNPREFCPGSQPDERDICPPQRYAPLRDRLYVNQGDGRFLDRSDAAGIRSDGKGLGTLAADFNGDGVTDVYVANDVVANHLYLGGPEFPLREHAEYAGIAYNAVGTPEGSMGVDFEDIDRDALPDLFVTNYELEDNSLYKNLGAGGFQHVTTRFGLAGVGRTLVGFGTGFHDFDADGFPDLYILNGHVVYHSAIGPFHQSPLLLKNQSGTRFADVTEQAGSWFEVPHAARGAAVADLDGDGSLDVVTSSLDEPVSILVNRLLVPGWIRLQLVGTVSPRLPIGAKVTFDSGSGQTVRILKSGAGYLSQSDPRILYYRPTKTESVEVRVTWPSGRRETFLPSIMDGDVVLVEGTGSDSSVQSSTLPNPQLRSRTPGASAKDARSDPPTAP